MKKILLLMMAVAMVPVSASATKIYVCGTKITGSTSFSAGGGTVTYNDNTRTLTITNVSYTKTGSSNNGISVDEVDGPLTINLMGTVMFDIKDADAVLCKSKKATTINVSGATDLYCRSSSHAALKLQEGDVTVTGSGRLDLYHNNSGHTVMGGTGTENLTLKIKECDMYASQSKFHKLNKVTINPTGSFGNDEYSTLLHLQNWSSSSPVCQATNVSSWGKGSGVKIIWPIEFYNESLTILTSLSCTDMKISDVSPVAVFNSSYFPDANFRSYLFGLYPKGYITTSDVNSKTSMNISGKSISNLQGIGYFSKLTWLDCSNNNLTDLYNVPTSLQTLYCQNNKITSFNYLQNCSSLKSLNCSNNQISSLTNLPTSIEFLDCSSNKFTILDFCNTSDHMYTKYYNLKTLNCSNNTQLTELWNSDFSTGGAALTSLNVSGCTSLTQIRCEYNKLTSLSSLPSSLKNLNVMGSQLTSLPTLPSGLEYLSVSSNKLTSFSLSNYNYIKLIQIGSNPLTSLTINNNSKLEKVYAYYIASSCTINCNNNSKLTILNVEDSPGLKTLNCYGNNVLTSLGVTGCTALTELDCHNNALTGISGLNSCTALTRLTCYNNNMTSLNLANFNKLNYLDCRKNKLTSLSVQGCTALRAINCCLNKFTASGANTLINSLCTIPAGYQGSLYYIAPGYTEDGVTEANVNLTAAQVNTARNKRWIPKKLVSGNWVDISVAVTGDVNNDGNVTSADVTAIYNYLLNNDSSQLINGDVNGDGMVTSADVTEIYNILLQ